MVAEQRIGVRGLRVTGPLEARRAAYGARSLVGQLVSASMIWAYRSAPPVLSKASVNVTVSVEPGPHVALRLRDLVLVAAAVQLIADGVPRPAAPHPLRIGTLARERVAALEERARRRSGAPSSPTRLPASTARSRLALRPEVLKSTVAAGKALNLAPIVIEAQHEGAVHLDPGADLVHRQDLLRPVHLHLGARDAAAVPL